VSVRLCVVHRGRAKPRGERGSWLMAVPVYRCWDYREMIQSAQKRLPQGIKVVLLADRGASSY